VKHQVKEMKHAQSLTYVVEVTDREGRVLRRIEAPSRSFVEQWNKVMNVQAKQSSSTIKDTGGVDRSVGTHLNNWRLHAAAAITDYGIRVGTGSTAVAIDDYAVETPLAEGVGVDQLNHLVMSYTNPAVDGSDCSFTIKRTMINNSGATISGVRELGAYMRMSAYYGLAFRDVLGAGVDVPDGGAITVEYTIKVTA